MYVRVWPSGRPRDAFLGSSVQGCTYYVHGDQDAAPSTLLLLHPVFCIVVMLCARVALGDIWGHKTHNITAADVAVTVLLVLLHVPITQATQTQHDITGSRKGKGTHKCWVLMTSRPPWDAVCSRCSVLCVWLHGGIGDMVGPRGPPRFSAMRWWWLRHRESRTHLGTQG